MYLFIGEGVKMTQRDLKATCNVYKQNKKRIGVLANFSQYKLEFAKGGKNSAEQKDLNRQVVKFFADEGLSFAKAWFFNLQTISRKEHDKMKAFAERLPAATQNKDALKVFLKEYGASEKLINNFIRNSFPEPQKKKTESQRLPRQHGQRPPGKNIPRRVHGGRR